MRSREETKKEIIGLLRSIKNGYRWNYSVYGIIREKVYNNQEAKLILPCLEELVKEGKVIYNNGWEVVIK